MIELNKKGVQVVAMRDSYKSKDEIKEEIKKIIFYENEYKKKLNELLSK